MANKSGKGSAFVNGVRLSRDGLTAPQYGLTYGRRKQRSKWFNIAPIRIKEIERLVQHRHGGIIPETDDDDTFVWVVAHHLAQTSSDVTERLAQWCKRHAPHFMPDRITSIAQRAENNPHRFKADRLGELLGLTTDERKQLQITTIQPKGLSKAEWIRLRKETKRQQDRQRAERRRRERGVRPRSEYLANALTRLEPWKADKISRRTWERRRAKLGASAS